MNRENRGETPFSTAQPGTSESAWQQSLRAVPEWCPASQRVCVVAPHPDDETFGAGGLIFNSAHRDCRITVILVTDGEKARPELPDGAYLRVGEFHSALTQLAHEPMICTRLGLPDGDVAQHRERLKAQLLRHLPRDCTLVAPFEGDGHADHVVTSFVCQEVARELGIECVRYPIWAWFRLQPQDLAGQSAVKVTLSDRAQLAKRRAINCYRSQTQPRPGGSVVPSHVLSYFNRPYEVFLQ